MILIIHPLDRSTKRLGTVASHLHRVLPDNRLFIVHPNDVSKKECHQAITECLESDLIIFLGHGRSDALYGAQATHYTAFAPNPMDEIDAELFNYYDEHFIDKTTYSLFKGKKFIAYGCKTSSLAKKLLDAGATVMLGFGAIPTSKEEFKDMHIDAPNILVAHMKGAITRILKNGIPRAIINQNSFAGLYRILEYEFQREIEQALASRFRFKEDLVNTLFKVKRDIWIEGDINVPLL